MRAKTRLVHGIGFAVLLSSLALPVTLKASLRAPRFRILPPMPMSLAPSDCFRRGLKDR